MILKLLKTDKPILLNEIKIIENKQQRKQTLTVPTNQEALEKIKATPGGANLIPEQQFNKKFTLNFSDTLALTPGVYAQKRFGEDMVAKLEVYYQHLYDVPVGTEVSNRFSLINMD